MIRAFCPLLFLGHIAHMPAQNKIASLARRLASRWPRSPLQYRRASTGPPHSGYEAFANPIPTHVPTPQEAVSIGRRNGLVASALFAAAGYGYYTVWNRLKEETDIKPPTEQHLINWSGTHECNVNRFYQPESLPELEAVVRQAHEQGQKLRCVGSGLSPNAIAFEEQGMVSLALLDKVLSVDPTQGLVTVQAGARVQEVADALRPHGLTLQNYASIREQTIGGFIQVSAHGTGAGIPPVDETVVGLKLVTPGEGTIELTKESDPELLNMARVGLGCLGVVAEVTLQCVPAHRLVERTFVTNAAEVKKKHSTWIKENKHLRYMWIPYTDAVVVVQCNEENKTEGAGGAALTNVSGGYSEAEKVEPMRKLALSRGAVSAEEAGSLSATQLRDALLAVAPLDSKWVAAVNAAEAEVWRRSAGTRSGWSDEILGFDCGGQQWVLEVAFPAGTRDAPSGADLTYMEELQALIRKHKVAAPAPIEQRWTSGSASPMSPAHGEPGSLHSWVGIIMYLPAEDLEKRAEVTAAFKQYARLVESELMPKYNATEHWAKIEVPQEGPDAVAKARERLAKRYPLKEFNAARRKFDPKNILGNKLVDTLLSVSDA